jgi:hypothetical protein
MDFLISLFINSIKKGIHTLIYPCIFTLPYSYEDFTIIPSLLERNRPALAFAKWRAHAIAERYASQGTIFKFNDSIYDFI